MASSASQSNPNSEFSVHHPHTQHQQQQQQQQHLDGGASHIGSNAAHGLNVAAAAVDYANDNHLAGLVQAATAAAGQDAGWTQNEDGDTTAMRNAGHGRTMQGHVDTYGVGMPLDDGGFGPSAANSQSSHPFGAIATGTNTSIGGGVDAERHTGSSPGFGSAGGSITRKRKREINVDPAMTAANAQFGAGPVGPAGGNGATGGIDNDGSGLDIRELPPQRAISDARAAGVHSAVALFRQPSVTSKKYTRPPMSKMFTSLELSPENFLHLQAAAKGYMLDENHPERRECVGQRGRGDTEMVKLRLWNCVRDFLDREGHGLRFFGEHVVNEGIGPRGMIWPRDDQKIISLVMPLLRRMVTNERQRQYALETRKGGGADDKKKKQAPENISGVPENVQRFHQPPPSGNVELGMLDLLRNEYPTYPTDWDSVAQAYDSYNQDYRLDNLGSISGLPQQDWWGLVAAVDCHYQIDHNGDAAQCDDSCIECSVIHLTSSEGVSQANWRIGDQGDDLPARNYFAAGITRDVMRHTRDTLINRPVVQQQQEQEQEQEQHPSPSAAQIPSLSRATESYHGDTPFPSSAPTQHQHQVHEQQQQPQQEPAGNLPVTIEINIIQDREHKRIVPRLNLPAEQCTDFSTLLSKIRQYYIQQQPQQSSQHTHLSSTMRVRMWLEEGLVPVHNDTEWMVGLVTACEIDWMDGELKVIVDRIGENNNASTTTATT